MSMNIVSTRQWALKTIAGFFLLLVLMFVVILLANAKDLLLLYAGLVSIYGGLLYSMRNIFFMKFIRLNSEGIEIEYRKSTEFILFSDIERLEVNKNGLAYKIFYKNKVLSINAMIFDMKKITFLTEHLYKNKPDLVNKLDFNTLRVNNFYSPKSVDYLTKLSVPLFGAVILLSYVLYTFQSNNFLFQSFIDYVLQSSFSLALVPVCIGMGLHFFAVKINTNNLIEKYKDGEEEIKQNFEFEKLVFTKTFAVFAVLLAAYFSLVFKYDLNLINRVVAGDHILYMDLQEGQSVWIDERPVYKRNADLTALQTKINYTKNSDNYLGVVDGLPGQRVTINIDSKGRKLASEETAVLSQNQYSVRGGLQGEEVKIIFKKDINGMVLNQLSDFF